MAPKKPTPFEQQPQADSSSDDEEEVSDEEEVYEESEEEEPKKPDPKPDSSSEEDGSDSGSDEETIPVAPVKPVVVQSPKVGAKSKQKQPAPVKPVVVQSPKVGAKSKQKQPAPVKPVVVQSPKVGAKSKQKQPAPVKPVVVLSPKVWAKSKQKQPAPATAPASGATVRKKRLGESKVDGKDSKKLKVVDMEDKRVAEEEVIKVGGSKLKAKGKRTPKPNMTPKEKHASSLKIPQVEDENTLFCMSELAKITGLNDDIIKKGFEVLSDEARAAMVEQWKNMLTAELELSYNRLDLSRELMKLTMDARKPSGHR